ncbi:hypothetical protein R1sor_020662 [Riccia sorocarpa]|uniref:Thaumatin-like protein n=1 Tax=Riccia sorocarpa TaxID=122646 RepID=A0ABD3GGA3_9MARC
MANSVSVLALAIATIFLTYGGSVNGCVVNIQNNCPFQVTGCSQTQTQDIAQYNLAAGGSAAVDLGGACSWPAAVVYASVTGQCAVSGQPAAATDRNLANLAEFTIGANGQDTYDLSNVNAYTIGLAINPSNSGCTSISCTIGDISGFCQPPNQLVTQPSSSQSCINTDGTNGLGPTDGTRQFKDACPTSYSYNFDDLTSTFTCATGTDYTVVFCP